MKKKINFSLLTFTLIVMLLCNGCTTQTYTYKKKGFSKEQKYMAKHIHKKQRCHVIGKVSDVVN